MAVALGVDRLEGVVFHRTSRQLAMASPGPASIRDSLRGKHVFITGASGFVGKCLVEKLLATVPDIAGIHVLIRARAGSSGFLSPFHPRFFNPVELLFSAAAERMRVEIFESQIFSRLRTLRGPAFDAELRSKVHAVPQPSFAEPRACVRCYCFLFVFSVSLQVAGELTQTDCGMSGVALAALYETIDVIIHCAAVVDFNEVR